MRTFNSFNEMFKSCTDLSKTSVFNDNGSLWYQLDYVDRGYHNFNRAIEEAVTKHADLWIHEKLCDEIKKIGESMGIRLREDESMWSAFSIKIPTLEFKAFADAFEIREDSPYFDK